MQEISARPVPASTGAAWRIAPFALLVALLALEEGLRASAWRDALDLRWLTVGRAAIVAAVLAFGWRHYSELRERPGLRGAGIWDRTSSQMALAVAAGLVVFFLWILLDHGWAVTEHARRGFVPLDANGKLDPWLYTLRLAGFALVVPVAEELFWRSFLLRWIDRRRFLELDPRTASFRAFALCSVLFAAEHSQWLAGLAAGMIYTGVYTKTGNLRAPIVSHAITNAALGLWILATGRWAFW
ncbi:MAG TPA: CAAX prenyl protease-related protein [Usitatibacter sp.]|nr:CAAX prenyl protease-related protein [Usitatibacter sp.]